MAARRKKKRGKKKKRRSTLASAFSARKRKRRSKKRSSGKSLAIGDLEIIVKALRPRRTKMRSRRVSGMALVKR